MLPIAPPADPVLANIIAKTAEYVANNPSFEVRACSWESAWSLEPYAKTGPRRPEFAALRAISSMALLRTISDSNQRCTITTSSKRSYSARLAIPSFTSCLQSALTRTCTTSGCFMT